jgi:predicted O-linked N-acetylglucosamine transferase (SPINDLY family)
MIVLREVEGSVLWLHMEDDDNPSARAALKQAASDRQVSPDRLIFADRVERDEPEARERLADLFLDTYPSNAGATANAALRAGLPVLTRRGASFASRVSASRLEALGLPELVARSAEDYVSKAIELARPRQRLAASAPFDPKRFARHLERAYTAMVERLDQGLPPEHIDVLDPDAAPARETGES